MPRTFSKGSYYYAKDVLKGDFPLGEPAIARAADFSYWYTLNVYHCRFELGEPVMKREVYWWKAYLAHIGRYAKTENDVALVRWFSQEWAKLYGQSYME